MKFGNMAVSRAEEAILAHSLRVGRSVIKKGTRLTAAHIEALRAAGVTEICVARLSAADIHENAAAARIASACAGAQVRVADAFTGRANLYAEQAGVLDIDVEAVDRLNAVSPAITLATLNRYAPVRSGQMIGTAKIIPFSVPATDLARALDGVRAAVRVAHYRAHRVGLISTLIGGAPTRIADKIRRATAHRLRACGSAIAVELRPEHEIDQIAAALKAVMAESCDLVLIFSASAIVDLEDYVPHAIGDVGGQVTRFGIPVDPGNLLLMARWRGVPVIGAPGCARSVAENGFDWVLQRVLAGIEITPADFAKMGVGGLLKEITLRPQPRSDEGREMPAPAGASSKKIGAASGKKTTRAAPRHQGAKSGRADRKIGGLILAAGQSRRMGRDNKLLTPLNGTPLIEISLRNAMESTLDDLAVITGNEVEKMATILAGFPVETVFNPDHHTGIASSIRSGIDHFRGSNVDGVLILLADMPAIDSAAIDRMLAAFRAGPQQAIMVACAAGAYGNPVLFSSHFFDALCALEGDRGARKLIEQNRAMVETVEIGAAAFCDLDTPSAFAAYPSQRAGAGRR